ncbi:MAG: hypothetical protein L0Z52_09455, partial [Acidobacteria bacterium]|nr:hypothetical protein [Acidobacteriota bacterium]
MNSTTDLSAVPTTLEFQQLKARLHREVLDRLNLESLQQMDRETATQGIRSLITDLMNQQMTPLSTAERRVIMDEILDE